MSGTEYLYFKEPWNGDIFQTEVHCIVMLTQACDIKTLEYQNV